MANRKHDVSDEQIVETYRVLGSGNATAKRLGICSPTVYTVLRRHAEPLVWKRGKQRVSDDAIIEAYRRLGSGIAVARQFKISDQTVYGVLNKHGVTTGVYQQQRRSVKGRSEHKAIALYRAGQSVPVIANKLGVSSASVRAALRRAKIYAPRIPWSDAEKERAVTLYGSGLTMKETAAAVGRSAREVWTLFHREYPHLPRPLGRHEKSPTWKGGAVIHKGYRYILVRDDNPFVALRSKAGYAAEHRLVMAEKLGRLLEPHETVHHINNDKLDNRPENLQLRKGRHGKGVVLQCRACGSYDVGAVEIGED